LIEEIAYALFWRIKIIIVAENTLVIIVEKGFRHESVARVFDSFF
jgi:hypothetical protein